MRLEKMLVKHLVESDVDEIVAERKHFFLSFHQRFLSNIKDF